MLFSSLGRWCVASCMCSISCKYYNPLE
uniref:Uncharacterized protein n=1 Tax=Rhizophora mucronata TaxID=61149 RepID=A0A2P2QSL0_RHIMU